MFAPAGHVGGSQVRNGLPPGGKWIRTLGPAETGDHFRTLGPSRGQRSWGTAAAEAPRRIRCRVGVAFFDHVALALRGAEPFGPQR